MDHTLSNRQEISRAKAWLRFFAGLVVFLAAVLFFSSGYSPPGIFGEVLRHNQANDIDATPLFYTEVEHMPVLENGVRKLREKVDLKTADKNLIQPVHSIDSSISNAIIK
jgi:hypothetical protein